MSYYISLGARGFLLRVGTTLIGAIGSLIYWRSARRREPYRCPESATPADSPSN